MVVMTSVVALAERGSECHAKCDVFAFRDDIRAEIDSESVNDWVSSYTVDDDPVGKLCDAFCEAEDSTC